MKNRFRVRVFWMRFPQWELGAVLRIEWDNTPALVLWLLFVGVRLGWDFEATPND